MIFTEQWVNGGVASFVVNVIKNFDMPNSFDIDVVVSEKITDFYDKALSDINVNIISMNGNERENPLLRTVKSSKKFKQILTEKNYDIIHFNLCNAVGLYYGKIAKKYCGGKIIVHSHNSMVGSNIKLIINNIFKNLLSDIPDKRFACSDYAARLLFDNKHLKDVEIINNGIDLEKFRYNTKDRADIRKQLNVNNEILICHVGRYIRQKNHKYLLEIFSCIKKSYAENVKLLLIGEGDLESDMDKYAAELGIDKDIIKIKNTPKVHSYLSASDFFLLPSLFEGLPIVGVEAQANGLPCLFSDTITRQLKLTESVQFLDIKMPVSTWCSAFEKMIKFKYDRNGFYDLVHAKGFDIIDVSKNIAKTYNDLK
ncbi:MAG: glycosyltransferase [Eubacterium sp.]|nr:glycosyltransferase [Eubacterium sp.]